MSIKEYIKENKEYLLGYVAGITYFVVILALISFVGLGIVYFKHP